MRNRERHDDFVGSPSFSRVKTVGAIVSPNPTSGKYEYRTYYASNGGNQTPYVPQYQDGMSPMEWDCAVNDANRPDVQKFAGCWWIAQLPENDYWHRGGVAEIHCDLPACTQPRTNSGNGNGVNQNTNVNTQNVTNFTPNIIISSDLAKGAASQNINASPSQAAQSEVTPLSVTEAAPVTAPTAAPTPVFTSPDIQGDTGYHAAPVTTPLTETSATAQTALPLRQTSTDNSRIMIIGAFALAALLILRK